MDFVVLVILAAAVLMIVGSVIARFVGDRRDRRAVQEVADRLGMRVLPNDVVGPPAGFTYFADRRSPTTRWVLTGGEGGATIFEYSYRDHRSNDEGTTRHRRTCVVLDLPFDSPPLELTTQPRVTFGRGEATPPVDVTTTTSEQFNERWTVYANDSDVAHRLLGPELEPALDELWETARARASESTLRIELQRGQMLVVMHDVPVAEYPDRLEQVRRLRSAMPVSMEVFYPRSNRDG